MYINVKKWQKSWLRKENVSEFDLHFSVSFPDSFMKKQNKNKSSMHLHLQTYFCCTRAEEKIVLLRGFVSLRALALKFISQLFEKHIEFNNI